jgi:hypothetical protein
MTEAFWQQHACGAFILDYCIVRGAPGVGPRRVDAVILPDE